MSNRSRYIPPQRRPMNSMTSPIVNPLDRIDQQREQIDAEEEDEQHETTAEEYTAASYVSDQKILLPSGKYIRLHAVSVTSLFRHGEIPNELLPAARKLLGVSASKATPLSNDEFLDLADFLTCKMVASFPVVNKRPNECAAGEVSVDQILECDKTAIIQFSQQGQAALKSFR